jgi:glucose-1-phosphate thymidylyltransferase
MIAVREVEDPRRFGVVEMDGDRVKAFVEKPDVPPSNLAIVGAYLFRDGAALWRSLDRIVAEDIRTRGEYQLTDALQMMVEMDIPFRTVPVTDWYDCGKKETWLETNRILLERDAPPAGDASVTPPVHVSVGAQVSGSRLGPHVSVGPGAVITGCVLSDCVVGAGSRLTDCRLDRSLVGENCVLSGVAGVINVGDYTELEIDGTRDG